MLDDEWKFPFTHKIWYVAKCDIGAYNVPIPPPTQGSYHDDDKIQVWAKKFPIITLYCLWFSNGPKVMQ